MSKNCCNVIFLCESPFAYCIVVVGCKYINNFNTKI